MASAGLLLCGCEQVPFASDEPALLRVEPEQPDLKRARRARELTAKVAFELARTEQERRIEYPRPSRWKTRVCPDSKLADLSEQDRTLMLTSQDARLDQRHVLPLRVLDPLSSHELRHWREKHAPAVNEFTGWHALRFEDPQRAATALEQLLAVKRRPLVGVYHVLDFRKPRWVRKPDRLKPEWLRGTLYAWFVVYDLRSDDSLCQVRIAVRNDVENASLRVRLRSDTRDSLITQLGEKLREQTASALGKISRVLRVPPS
jgi:hypothetical protein